MPSEENTLNNLWAYCVIFVVKVYAAAEDWFNSLSKTVSNRITQHFGPFPVKDRNINVRTNKLQHFQILTIYHYDRRKMDLTGYGGFWQSFPLKT